MRYLILLLLIFPLAGVAQTDRAAIEFNKTILVPGKHAGGLFMRALALAQKHPDAFYYGNNTAEEAEQVLKRSGKNDDDIAKMIGYQRSDRGKGIVWTKGIFAYEQMGNEHCIKLLLISFDLTITAVRGEADVEIENLNYCHYNNGKPAGELPITTGDKSIAAKGSYEDLISADVCPDELAKIKIFVKEAADRLLHTLEINIARNLKANEVDW